MRRPAFQLPLVLMVFVISVSCELFEVPVGETTINDHNIIWTFGSPRQIDVWWNWADEAEQHILERSAPDDNSGFKELTWDTVDFFGDAGWDLPDNAFVPGHRYIYRVRGHGDAGFGPWSPEYTVTIPPFLAPANVTATLVSADPEYIRVTWDAVDVPDVYYEIHRSTELDGTYYEVQTQPGTIYEDSQVDTGKTYYYKIRCSHTSYGQTEMSQAAAVDTSRPNAPQMYQAVLEGNSIIVRWDPVAEADRYKLYRSETNTTGSYAALWSYFEYPDESGGHFVTDGDYLKYVDSAIVTGTNYYYKAECEVYGGLTSELSATPASFQGGGGSGSWLELETGFPSTAYNATLITHGSELYTLLSNDEDTDKRIKVMKNSGADGAAWSDVGGYISLGAVDGDSGSLFSDNSGLYVAYADSDDSVASGETPRLFVKTFTGSAWSAVGSTDGVRIYDTDSGMAQGKWGSVPALTVANTSPFLVYRTGSGGVVDSLSFPGSGEYWEEADSSFWSDLLDPDPVAITAAWIELDTDASGSPIAALQGGSSTSVELYRYDGSIWAAYSALDLSGDYTSIETVGFFLDGSDHAYVACETYSDTTQFSAGVYRYNGSSWTDTGLASQLQDVEIVTGIGIAERISGTGLYAVAAYKTTSTTYFLELWEYDGSSWQQMGPDIDLAAAADSISVTLDSNDRPVIMYADSDTGDVTIVAYR